MASTLNGSAVQLDNRYSNESGNRKILSNGNNSTSTDISQNNDEYTASWGFNIKELYSLATTFLKEKDGKAFHLSYRDKLALVAFTQQVTHGKFVPEKSPPVGYLDVIGRDRRQAWAALGDMSAEDAKAGFISLLDNLCPLFRPFVQAHKCDLEEKERRRKLEEEKRLREAEELEQMRLEEEARLQEERERERQVEQKRLIQEALNRQTFHQFKAYAEQQCPGDPEKQAVLIRQLQKHHYEQYMNQVIQQQASKPKNNSTSNCDNSGMAANIETNQNGSNEAPVQSSGESEEEIEMSQIAAASMWTRKDIQEFKNNIRKEGGDGIIKVGHGETVTVRVPTHNDGTCLFWEFATDSFDLGFGVYFEWTKTPDAQVSVHISESEDEDEDDEEMDQPQPVGDIEKGVHQVNKNPLSVIIPVYRRDCHEEVYAGSHIYPGQGVYLLKFDNSYSLWRSKTLYYRVYYTR